jgi:hypothetical protein
VIRDSPALAGHRAERRDFIREIVAADVAACRIAAPVTRFPPVRPSAAVY